MGLIRISSGAVSAGRVAYFSPDLQTDEARDQAVPAAEEM